MAISLPGFCFLLNEKEYIALLKKWLLRSFFFFFYVVGLIHIKYVTQFKKKKKNRLIINISSFNT